MRGSTSVSLRQRCDAAATYDSKRYLVDSQERDPNRANRRVLYTGEPWIFTMKQRGHVRRSRYRRTTYSVVLGYYAVETDTEVGRLDF